MKLKIVYILMAGLLLFASACKEETIVPTTGDLVLRISNGFSGTLFYELYPESYLSANRNVFPLVEGQVNGGSQLRLSNLNQGNYIFRLNGLNYAVQVSAGRERSFTID